MMDDFHKRIPSGDTFTQIEYTVLSHNVLSIDFPYIKVVLDISAVLILIKKILLWIVCASRVCLTKVTYNFCDQCHKYEDVSTSWNIHIYTTDISKLSCSYTSTTK